jgi:hypothetical protein
MSASFSETDKAAIVEFDTRLMEERLASKFWRRRDQDV